MKRKLRIFGHLAIICLSVCMFAFGVYAASTVSVTTSGTVSFVADGVYAEVAGTITGMKGAAPTLATLNYSSSQEPTEAELNTWKNNLTFNDNGDPIVLTITITNKATDRNLDFVVTDSSEDGTNITRTCKVSANLYDETNGKYNVNPQVTGIDNIETVTIIFEVADKNVSAELDYSYNISLNNQANFNTTFVDTASVQKYGNTFVASVEKYKATGQTEGINVLTVGKSLNGYTLAGTTKYYEHTTNLNSAKDRAVSYFHVYGDGLTSISPNIVDTVEYLSFSFSDNCGQVWRNATCPATIVIPMAVNTEDDFMVVEKIYDDAFSSESNLTNAVLPNSLKKIGYRAFSGTKLNTINLPDSLEYLAEWALMDYYGTSLYIPKNVNEIGNGYHILNTAPNLTTIIVDTNNLLYTSGANNNMILEITTGELVGVAQGITAFEIPKTVKIIGSEAFYNCAITSLTIPSGVTSIGYSALDYCTSLEALRIESINIEFEGVLFSSGLPSMENVYFVGTVEEFNALTGVNGSGLFMYTIHCSNGDIIPE